jgi:hypothetical protein
MMVHKDQFGHELKDGDKVIHVRAGRSFYGCSYRYVVAFGKTRVKLAESVDSEHGTYVGADRCIRVASIEVDDDA